MQAIVTHTSMYALFFRLQWQFLIWYNHRVGRLEVGMTQTLIILCNYGIEAKKGVAYIL